MSPRIEEEKKTVSFMIRLYCRRQHAAKELCPSCQALLDYAMQRLEHCKFGDQKGTCRRCPIHCYKPQMREQIRAVMRYSGPRMIFYHPLAAIRHLYREFKH